MTTSVEQSGQGVTDAAGGDAPPRSGRSELLVAPIVVGIGVFLLIATARMDVSSTANYLGPQFFPAVVGAMLVVLGVLLGVQMFVRTRSGRAATADSAAESETPSEGSDWKPLGITLATLAAHAALLTTLGWIIAGALLFFGVSYALGGRKVLRDLGISFIVSSSVQVAFSAGLGLTLPPGILIGVV